MISTKFKLILIFCFRELIQILSHITHRLSFGNLINLETNFDLYHDQIDFWWTFSIQIHRPNLNRHNEIDSNCSKSNRKFWFGSKCRWNLNQKWSKEIKKVDIYRLFQTFNWLFQSVNWPFQSFNGSFLI